MAQPRVPGAAGAVRVVPIRSLTIKWHICQLENHPRSPPGCGRLTMSPIPRLPLQNKFATAMFIRSVYFLIFSLLSFSLSRLPIPFPDHTLYATISRLLSFFLLDCFPSPSTCPPVVVHIRHSIFAYIFYGLCIHSSL